MTRSFPRTRLRRNRAHDFSRRLTREHTLTADDLIYPMFVIEGSGRRVPVSSMPGIERLTVDELIRDAERAVELGVPAVALFPNVGTDTRSEDGAEAWNPEGLVPRAVAALKQALPELGVITDAALDPYTTHGHDGQGAGPASARPRAALTSDPGRPPRQPDHRSTLSHTAACGSARRRGSPGRLRARSGPSSVHVARGVVSPFE